MNNKIYANGFYYKNINIEKAPFIKGEVSMQANKAIEFIKANTNSRGYCNLTLKEGREGFYFELNTWEKGQTTNTQNIDNMAKELESDIKYSDVNGDVDNIPF